MSTVNTGWLKDNSGEKFAPKTLSSQIVTDNGKTLDVMVADVKSNINSLSESVVYMDEYDNSIDVNTAAVNTGSTVSSGIYIGSGEMPEGCNVKIDPEGSASEVVTKGEFDALSAEVDELNNKIEKLWTPYWTDNIDVTSKIQTIDLTNEFFNHKEVYIEALFTGETYDSCILPIVKNSISKHAVLRGLTSNAGNVIITLSDTSINMQGFSNGTTTVQIVSIMVR